ncbi:putative rhamnogalacturonate lyase A [Diplonema papillatum]|nr:putative rhamnogalacturonate lyase A [Diplonema papillatum]
MKKTSMLCLLVAAVAVQGDFGVTETDEFYTIDSGAGLVFDVRRLDNGSSVLSVGAISSLKLDGEEYLASGEEAHLNSGFDRLYTAAMGATDVNVTASEANDTITVEIHVGAAAYLTHYYIVRKGERTIYMATYYTQTPDIVDAWFRYDAVRCSFNIRFAPDKLTNVPKDSDIRGFNGTMGINEADIYTLENGETRSTWFATKRSRDWNEYGATNEAETLGVYFVRGKHDGDTGGPFYKVPQQLTRDEYHEMTFYLSTAAGMSDLAGGWPMDVLRTHNVFTYALNFTSGSFPDIEEETLYFLEDFGIRGYVPEAERGQVKLPGFEMQMQDVRYTTWMYNDQANYFGSNQNNKGYVRIGSILPGDYTVIIYKLELEIYRSASPLHPGSFSLCVA